jgi:hypothetical protein
MKNRLRIPSFLSAAQAEQAVHHIRDVLIDTLLVSASALTAMILSAALAREAAPAAGRVLVVVFLAVTTVVGGWLTGQWITGGIGPDSVHPGYFLPTATGAPDRRARRRPGKPACAGRGFVRDRRHLLAPAGFDDLEPAAYPARAA